MKIFGESLKNLAISHHHEFSLIRVDEETIITASRSDVNQVFIISCTTAVASLTGNDKYSFESLTNDSNEPLSGMVGKSFM